MFLAIPEVELTQFKKYVRELQRGDVVFEENDPPDDCIYLLRQGQVHVERGGRSLGDISALEFVGEMAALTGKPRTATVTVKSDKAVLYAFPKANIESILANKRWGRMLAERMAENLEARLRDVDRMQAVEAKLYSLLAELSLLSAAATTDALKAALGKGVPEIVEMYIKRLDRAKLQPVEAAQLDALKQSGALSNELHTAATAKLTAKP